ncbi:MAG: nitrophenyl compound nitroreductase subunit ArsF family protein [Planctomycetaceae bacterium]|nr:nitrophenyl compound nitroreductase subunit ArsF family protein [Planctomycetaceae bacterium]
MAFLLVSIGVAIGKEMAGRGGPAATPPTTNGREKVMVYYMHGIPCVTCTFIETTAQKLVREEFAGQVAAGKMEFASISYLDPASAALADKYNVGENMVIAVRLEGDKETSRARMDKVMQLAGDEARLKDYLRQGIRSVLEGTAK